MSDSYEGDTYQPSFIQGVRDMLILGAAGLAWIGRPTHAAAAGLLAFGLSQVEIIGRSEGVIPLGT